MPDLPYGKLIFALVAIFVLIKATAILMWTIVAAIVVYMIRLIPDRTYIVHK